MPQAVTGREPRSSPAERDCQNMAPSDSVERLMVRYGLTLFLLAALSSAAACGNGEDDSGAADDTAATTVTAIIPGITAELSVEYTIDCSQGSASVQTGSVREDPIEGMLALSGTLEDTDGITSFWKTRVEIPPDGCNLDLIALDGDGEAICTANEEFAAGGETPSDVYLEMVCGFCFCQQVGDVVVTVETLAEPDPAGAQSVTYTINCDDSFLDNDPPDAVTVNGNLELVGGESVPSNTWQGTFKDLPVGSCALTVSADDLAGESLCSIGTSFLVIEGQVGQVRVVLPCEEPSP